MNSRKPWSIQDKNTLKILLQNGKSISIIAKTMGRSESAIKSASKKYASTYSTASSSSSSSLYIYVLKCKQQKYYVGKTHNPDIRINQHIKGKGSSWTKKYEPIEVVEIIADCDGLDEDKYTKRYMYKHGIDNVRGGSYCRVELDIIDKLSLLKEKRTLNNLCFYCGKKHMVKYCKIKQYIAQPEDGITLDISDSDSDTDDLSSDSGVDLQCVDCDEIFENLDYYNEHVGYCKGRRRRRKVKQYTNLSCYRCGRRGHLANKCFANSHLK